MKKQDSFNGEAHLLGEERCSLSQKTSHGRIEHSQLSPVHEELLPTLFPTPGSPYSCDVLMVEKAIDAICQSKGIPAEKLAITKAVINDASNPPLFGGIMTLVMSIATMLRVSCNMPRKVLGAAIGSATPSTFGAQSTSKSQAPQQSKIPVEAVSVAEYAISAKHLADLEEKVSALLARPAEMPADKEEMLKAAVSRVSALEEELAATKKALQKALERQGEIIAYIEREKKKKGKCLQRLFRW